MYSGLHGYIRQKVFNRRFFWMTWLYTEWSEFAPTRYWSNWITGEVHTVKKPLDKEQSWQIVKKRINYKHRTRK
jgi:hypothetical protein